MLNAYPEAASIPDPVGDFPLHLSLHAGNTWITGVKEIFEAAPNVIYVRDRASRQFPFMITASRGSNTNGSPKKELNTKQHEVDLSHQKEVDLLELTTVFELLLRDPCAVMSTF